MKIDPYKISQEIISQILDELKKFLSYINSTYTVRGRKSDAYYLINSSFYVPKGILEHTIIFRAFERDFLSNFIKLYEHLFNDFDNIENLYQEFSFRTLHDLSFNKAPLIFGDSLSTNEKQKYKLILMLDDYVYIYQNYPTWLSEHKKLIAEKKSLLSEDELKKIEKAYRHLENNELPEANKLTAQMLADEERLLKQKVIIHKWFNKNALYMIYKGFSKLNHGDIPLMNDLFSNRRGNSLKYRKTYFLLATGLNMLILFSKEFDKIQLDLDKIFKQYTKVFNLLKSSEREIT